MKKYLLVLIIMLLVVTGCGEKDKTDGKTDDKKEPLTKTLTCEMKDTDGNTQKVVAEFDKDNYATVITMNMSMPFEEDTTKEEAEAAAAFVCAMIDYEGASCDTEVSDKAMDVVIKFDMSKMSDEAKEEMGYDKENSTYDAMKKSMEETGATCK